MTYKFIKLLCFLSQFIVKQMSTFAEEKAHCFTALQCTAYFAVVNARVQMFNWKKWKYVTVFFSVVRGRTAAVHGAVPTERDQGLDRALIQQLRERCELQALQLQSLQAQFKKASLCLDVFSITTQHFCHKVGYRRSLGNFVLSPL